MKIFSSSFTTVIVLLAISLSTAEITGEFDEILAKELPRQVEIPDVFGGRGHRRSCAENGKVAAWCNTEHTPSLACGILPDFDEYGCACLGDASSCPDECISGFTPSAKTHYGIRCQGIPPDEPNYVLKENHALNRCENNAVVSSWCDDFVNMHLTCKLHEDVDEYSCHCGGKHSACPEDCVGGLTPIETTHNVIRCKGIPLDQPNYILKEG
ncbi:predicted protein [Phaeodactylum tricornutum CCAP 1055/1]|jgi:hypothetical protein|uniref:Uncharacterized protein n=1 Tax=Phaeodactylum tricornutum (strain CCAP 1055/1) TaxID=556484 RepID=B5Y3N1_PHATC|nr:predicted protein [Phaeodactylum tricornutum CCAP 1055/1]ACI65337.1 predicted protein [Phaeodactylum tricornutum CCAP 1055/1]|eukprot:XP_002185867.1 predicted protein [Phaeodactylum tricornutum CCAP 1055/1]